MGDRVMWRQKRKMLDQRRARRQLVCQGIDAYDIQELFDTHLRQDAGYCVYH